MLSRIFRITNNPGNLVFNGEKWLGSCGTYRVFIKFNDVEYGLRALIIVLLNYTRYGFNSVRLIVTRFAPPHENDTEAYISYVEKHLIEAGLSCTDITFGSDAFVLVCQCISRYETGFVLTKECYRRVVKKFNIHA